MTTAVGLNNVFMTSKEIAELLTERTANSVAKQIEIYLTPVMSATDSIKSLYTTVEWNKERYPEIETLLMNQINLYPTIRAINVGFNDGDFLMVKKNFDDTISIKEINRNDSSPYVHWKHYDEEMQLISSELTDLDDYNHLERDWYKGTLKNNGIYWSQVYQFFTDKDYGITVGLPIYYDNEVVGVISYDYKLTALDNYINSLTVTDSGEVLVLNYKDDIVAFSSSDLLLKENIIRPIKMNMIEDTSVLEVINSSNRVNDDVNMLKIKGKEYFYTFRKLNSLENNKWQLLLMIPEEDLLRGYWTTRDLMIAAIVMIIILLLMLNYYRKSEMSIKNNLIVLTQRDALTNLYNRRTANEKYLNWITGERRRIYPITVILCDIDFFKKINDNYGHDCGDYVLKQIAQLLVDNTRENDVVSRWGGEEFMILLKDTNLNEGSTVAETLRVKTELSSLEYGGEKIRITMSFGLATTDQKTDLDQVVNQADKNLYIAKKNGRNQVIYK